MTAPDTAARPRVPFWDNARFVSVTLVVIGHAIQRLTSDSNNALVLYLFIYAFHMPAFAIISGYFSKASPPTTRRMKKVLTDILLPYVIMEAIWTFVQWIVEGKQEFNPTNPSWTLWFLLALGIFRLVLPYLVLVRYPLVWALLLSVMVGYFDNVDSTFSLSRAIGILPFFVLGWQARQWGIAERFLDLGRAVWGLRAGAVAVLAAWLLVVVIGIEQWRAIDLRFWFFYDDSYRGLGEDQWWAGLVRLGLIALAILLSASFFVLVPRTQTWITGFGQATMYVYLLHSFVLYPFRESGILRNAEPTWIWLPIVIVLSVVIALALATRPVRRLFRPLVEPRARWLFADERLTADASRRDDPTGSRRPRER